MGKHSENLINGEQLYYVTAVEQNACQKYHKFQTFAVTY